MNGPSRAAFLTIALAALALGGTAVAAPTPAPRPISDAQFAKLAAQIPIQGHEQAILKQTTDALGITKAADPALALRQIGTDDGQGTTYVLSPLPDGKGYLFADVNMQATHAFWVDKNLALVAATVKAPGKTPVAMPPDVAHAELDGELRFWAAIANKL
jgi:hypothetical protein